MSLGAMRSPELRAEPRRLLAVPLGACEQHGPHLPLHTDTVIATELCTRLAARRPDVVVAPAIPYGSSGEHAGFPGTLSIGQAAVELLLVELVRSADEFTGVVLVNGHGGNHTPLHAAARTLRAEGRRVLTWSPTGPADDSHAGHTETAVLLHLYPTQVAMAYAEPGNTRPLPELLDTLRHHGVAGVSPNGVLGDPRNATAADGDTILRRWTDHLATAVDTWSGRNRPG